MRAQKKNLVGMQEDRVKFARRNVQLELTPVCPPAQQAAPHSRRSVRVLRKFDFLGGFEGGTEVCVDFV